MDDKYCYIFVKIIGGQYCLVLSRFGKSEGHILLEFSCKNPVGLLKSFVMDYIHVPSYVTEMTIDGRSDTF